MEKLQFIYDRVSVRKFKDEEVKHEDLVEIIKAGMHAPSAHNIQNWHYVVIENKEKINEIGKVIRKKHNEIIEAINDEDRTKRFKKMIRYYTFFEDAPVLVLLYKSEYQPGGIDLLNEVDIEAKDGFISVYPDTQNIGATIENILLASTVLGYGGCWMTGPLFAKKEIEEYISLDKEGFNLNALIPIGVPTDGKHKSPERAAMEEKVTFL
jgi:nitroreductase